MRIVLVDDEPSVLRILKRHLEASDHEVFSFSEGGEAQDWLRKNTADLLIIDEIMPGSSGTEVIQNLKALRPDESMWSILMSGYPEDGFASSADAFLQKPFSPDSLNATLLRLVTRTNSKAETQGDRKRA